MCSWVPESCQRNKGSVCPTKVKAENFRPAEWLSVSQEELCYMELLSVQDVYVAEVNVEEEGQASEFRAT
jgi:hypothetical protein